MMQWVENYVKGMVGNPEAVSLDVVDGVQTKVVTISVADEDRTLFDGRNNRLVRALNQVVGLAGAKERRRFVLKFGD